MKKLLFGTLVLLSTLTFGQDLSLQYGSSDTFIAGLSDTTDGGILGINCSFFVGNSNTASYMPLSSIPDSGYSYKDDFTTPYTAVFMTAGHQWDRVSLTMRLGAGNTYKYTRYTKNSAPYYYRESTPYDLLAGICVGYKLEDDFGLNAGFDNFNGITAGITIYWGKSHHTNHMCKPKPI